MMLVLRILAAALSMIAAIEPASSFAVGRTACRHVTCQFTKAASLSSSTCLLADRDDAASTERPTDAGTSSAEPTPEASATLPKKKDMSNDILNSPAFLKRKLDVLKSDLAKVDADLEAAKQQLTEGKAEWASQLEDLQREYQTIQDRMNTQSKQGDAQATMQVARRMLDVLDNYDRAFGSIKAETDEHKIIEAEYKRAYDMILEMFTKLGIEEIETVGTEFNYEVHQAVMQRPSDQFEEGIVCEELSKGFKVGDVLVRAAMVAVAA